MSAISKIGNPTFEVWREFEQCPLDPVEDSKSKHPEEDKHPKIF